MHIFNQWSTTYKKNSDNLVLGRASNNILIDTSRPSPRQSEKIPKTHLFGDFLVPAFRPGHQPEVWCIPTNSASKSRKSPRSDVLVKIDIAIADFSKSGFRTNFVLRQCTGIYTNLLRCYSPTTSNSHIRTCIKNAHCTENIRKRTDPLQTVIESFLNAPSNLIPAAGLPVASNRHPTTGHLTANWKKNWSECTQYCQH